MKVEPAANAASSNTNNSAAPARSFSDVLRGAPPRGAAPAGRRGQPAKPSAASTFGEKLGAKANVGAPRSPAAKPQPTAQPKGKEAQASDLHQRATDIRTKSARQLDASQRTEKVHAQAHAESAEISAFRHSERAEDAVRVGLFQALERECAGSQLIAPQPDPDGRPGQSPNDHLGHAVAVAPASASQFANAHSNATQRAEAVAALVDRIDAALKNGQPTMSLGLNDRSGASAIEVTRTGKGEVAVRIAARGGRKAQIDAARGELESALASRGLRVKSLTIG